MPIISWETINSLNSDHNECNPVTLGAYCFNKILTPTKRTYLIMWFGKFEMVFLHGIPLHPLRNASANNPCWKKESQACVQAEWWSSNVCNTWCDRTMTHNWIKPSLCQADQARQCPSQHLSTPVANRVVIQLQCLDKTSARNENKYNSYFPSLTQTLWGTPPTREITFRPCKLLVRGATGPTWLCDKW